MTKRQLVASLTVSAAALGLAAVGAARSFPLQAQGHEEASGQAPIRIARGGENLLHGSLPEYPRRAVEQGVQGDVVVDLTIDERGEVADARVVSGPEELRRAALESVLQWHYSPAAVRSTSMQATVSFNLAAQGSVEFGERKYAAAIEKKEDERTPAQRAERLLEELAAALVDPNISAEQREEYLHKQREAREMLSKIRAGGMEGRREGRPEVNQTFVRVASERVPESTLRTLLEQADLKIGDEITEETARRLTRVASTLDEHLRVTFSDDGDGGLVLMVVVLPGFRTPLPSIG
jgi:TonB family protein